MYDAPYSVLIIHSFFLHILHICIICVLCVLLMLSAVGGQLWWANAFFWLPAMITCYVCICCYLSGKIKFLLLCPLTQSGFGFSCIILAYNSCNFSIHLLSTASVAVHRNHLSCRLSWRYLVGMLSSFEQSVTLSAIKLTCIRLCIIYFGVVLVWRVLALNGVNFGSTYRNVAFFADSGSWI